jgi:2-polyprenyl-6-methoxyphenol hydroxylase-like FAD-dependent oxidoreductase
MVNKSRVLDVDVLVVGAGPVGLMLAIDLGRRGIRTLLIEKDPSTKQWPKMDRSNARTMEFFRRMGVADDVRALGYPGDGSMDVLMVTSLAEPPLAVLNYRTVDEHRAVIAATRDGSQPLEPYQLVSQNDLEPLLVSLAERQPTVTVRFGAELTGFEQDDDGVDARIGAADGSTQTVLARYLVGCDGGVSTVRKGLGISLQGRGGIADQLQITFRSATLYDRIGIGKGRHYYFADEDRAGLVVQGSRREFTLNLRPRDDMDLQAEIASRIGPDIDFEIVNSRRWKLHLLLAERYRQGRVFIAGDAAHLVIPSGGLGMNTGVGDALDLAWKLAGTIQGWGGSGLLDSYETERRKVGRRNVEAAGWAAEGMFMWQQTWSPPITDDSLAGERARAESAAASVHIRRIYEMVGVELGYSYAGSDLIAYEPDNVVDWDTLVYTPHARPGVRLPHVWLSDGRAIQDLLDDGYVLLDLIGDADTDRLAAAFADRGAPLQVLHLDEPAAREVYGAPLLLLRPDMHVFWRGDRIIDPDEMASAATGFATVAFATSAAPAAARS